MDLVYRLSTDIDEDLINWLSFSSEHTSSNKMEDRKEFLRHLLVFRQVMADDSDSAIILDSSVNLPSHFEDSFDEISDDFDHDVIILSHNSGNELEIESFCENGNAICQMPPYFDQKGIKAYWVSREWIERCLHLYDKPWRMIPPIELNKNLLITNGRVGVLKDSIC